MTGVIRTSGDCFVADAAAALDRENEAMADKLSVCLEPPNSAAAQAILRDYLAEVVGRFHGRPLTADELDGAVAEFPHNDLVLPQGVLLIARLGEHVIGCAGLRIGEDRIGEIVRVFVTKQHRRRGMARALITEVEAVARHQGLRRLRLDTRHDLTEARQLCAALGYNEVAPFNDEPYAEHWFERSLVDPVDRRASPADFRPVAESAVRPGLPPSGYVHQRRS